MVGRRLERQEESERDKDMNWIERILSSDAGRGGRELAEKMVREAGGEVPEEGPSSDEVKPEVLKGEYS